MGSDDRGTPEEPEAAIVIRGETYCLADDPAVGYSVWEAADRASFEKLFREWKPYYADVEVRPLISPGEAMRRLLR